MITIEQYTIIKRLKSGTAFKLYPEDLNYYIRDRGRNGRIQAKCYTAKHERNSFQDRNLTRDTKVYRIKIIE